MSFINEDTDKNSSVDDSSTNDYSEDEAVVDNQWRCKRCNHDATTKGNLLSHLKKKTPCIGDSGAISIEDYVKELTTKHYEGKVYECKFCNAKFTTRQAKYKHKFCCKLRHRKESQEVEIQQNKLLSDIIKGKDDELEQQRTVIERLTKELEIMKEKRVQLVINVLPQEEPKKSKYKKKKISHAVKIKCWNTHIGELIPKKKCLCCDNVDITQHNFHCGHIITERNGGTYEIKNLLPICNVCNNSMGTMNMNEFKSMYGFTTSV